MDFPNFGYHIQKAEKLIQGVDIARSDLVQSDMLCYDVPTNERYDEVKTQLAIAALLLDESMVNGRLIAVFQLKEPLRANGWEVSFVELPQPKSGEEVEGIDHIQFVTRTGISQFAQHYPDVAFKEKGNELNRLLQIESDSVKVRFHDKHIGAVLELERDNAE